MKKLYIDSFDTAIGTIHTAVTDKGVALILLPCQSTDDVERVILRHFPDYEVVASGRMNNEVRRQITAYARGKLRRFTLELHLVGTPFQQKVLRQVARIPYGTTMSYGEIAQRVGHPRASRAVGTVNARNNLPLVVPCHRVVASNGIGGYGGGLPMKKRLLFLEGALESPDGRLIA